jgi:mannobiose 2-epimerase
MILKERILGELTGNILPYWLTHVPDPDNGGFFGGLSNTGVTLNDLPRSAILTARILWTFSAAFNRFQLPEYRTMARRAYETLRSSFVDPEFGGVYWTLDRAGRVLMDRKHSYAQSFAIYGLSEYYLASGDLQSLVLAQEIFDLLESHAHEPVYGGYVEGCARDWSGLEDMRLSKLEPNCRKSMNTLLHLMEAYTRLLYVWKEPRVRARLAELIALFLEKVVDPASAHLRLFFDDVFTPQIAPISFGHDIEASWLLVEAAEGLGDPALLERARQSAVRMAAAVLAEGRAPDGSLLYEDASAGPGGRMKHWWVQAEGLVGFYNAYQINADPAYAAAAGRLWEVIEAQFVDRADGDWFKVLDPDGSPQPDRPKVGPWECPYHHSRACLEMLRRLP